MPTFKANEPGAIFIKANYTDKGKSKYGFFPLTDGDILDKNYIDKLLVSLGYQALKKEEDYNYYEPIIKLLSEDEDTSYKKTFLINILTLNSIMLNIKIKLRNALILQEIEHQIKVT